MSLVILVGGEMSSLVLGSSEVKLNDAVFSLDAKMHPVQVVD